MTNEEKLKLIGEALSTGEKLPKETAWELMRNATTENKELTMLWKIPNEKYQKWYDEDLLGWYKKTNRPILTTIEDETTYIVHSGAKAFDPSKIGYSIFAVSVGMLKRNDDFSIDRIERLGCEWAIIIELDKE